MRAFIPATLAVCTLLAAGPALAAPAETEEPAAKVEPQGARANVGFLLLGHAKRPSEAASSSFGFAPGLTIGGGYRVGAWELEISARAAYLSRSEQRETPPPPPELGLGAGQTTRYAVRESTLFGGVGGGARWFASRSSSSAFLAAGLDFLVLRAGDLFGVGPALRAGVGVELWHDSAHHRLALEANLSFPMFRLEGPSVDSPSGSTTASGAPLVYVVPMTTTARWTF